MDTEVSITLRDGKACFITVPASAEPQTLEIQPDRKDGEFRPLVKGPKGMTVAYRKAVFSLTDRQRPA